MAPRTVLLGGDLRRGDVSSAVEVALGSGVETVLVRTDDGEVRREAEAAGAEAVPSGRRALADAAAEIAERVAAGELSPDDVDPDVVREVSGEREVQAVVVAGSNRLVDAALLGTTYAEYFFVDELDAGTMERVLDEFEERTRRFGE